MEIGIISVGREEREGRCEGYEGYEGVGAAGIERAEGEGSRESNVVE